MFSNDTDWYQFKYPQRYNSPNTSIQELTELLFQQADIYTKHFGYPCPPMIEEMLIGYGYMNMQMGYPEKAYLFLKMGTEYYPNSADTYDAMADFYLDQKDLRALHNHTS